MGMAQSSLLDLTNILPNIYHLGLKWETRIPSGKLGGGRKLEKDSLGSL